ncbi:MAG: hypothetical protein HRT43_12170, partial [Campylobacteraceae bacterium]|nr:hypothetical protein [Campylobacteraceae bacterium]
MSSVVEWIEDAAETIGDAAEGVWDGLTGSVTLTEKADDYTWVTHGLFGKGILTLGGDDIIRAAALGKLVITDTTGDLDVYGAALWVKIKKTGIGNANIWAVGGKVDV